VQIARRTRRRKYESHSLTILGQALAKLGRRDEAVQSLRRATDIADELVGAPARWRTRAPLGRVLHEFGDDDGAAATYGEAAELIESFAATLAPERAATLRTAPEVEEVSALAGRRAAR
jgi:Flp pilus assembly protein TadD